ncbi:MAG: T9SS type A sorting domain-containing protein [Saprospiraceae bacterium]|nr:T9SS type A sorting domain-containing protein [Saprospiraceae bacterium]
MRNRALLTFCFIAFIFFSSFGQCPEFNITIKTQAELNQLFASYPNCHKIKKSISFINSAANPFTDLSAMLKIDTILGDLVLNVKNTPTIQGLSNIKYIGGDLSILSTDQLTTFPAFDSLQKVGLNIEIQNNPKLKSVRGFNQLTKVGTISISENELMDTIDAFNEVDTLLSTFSIHFMKKLEVVRACEKLKYCGNTISLNFQFSPNLKTIPAFDQLRFVKSDFTISEANSLSYQGLQSLDSLGSRLILAFPLATHFQLAPNARYINDLNLTNCPNLTTLEGFDQLISASNIALNLPALTQLCPFPNLEKAMLGLFLQLPELPNFDAFLNLKEAGDIYLSANKATDIQFAPQLQKVNGPMKLYGFKTQSFNHFNQLIEVKGELDLNLTEITYLPEFDLLQYVKSLNINGTFNLKRIEGFNKLHTIIENLGIYNQSVVDSILGFQQLRYCGGSFTLSGNKTLVYLTDFPSLDTLGQLSLRDNYKLPTLNGFNQLRYLYNNQFYAFYIYNCFALASVDGFENLDYCGEINVVNSVGLKKISGFNNLREVNGNVTFDSRIEVLPDFNNLEIIRGKLTFNSVTLTKLPSFQKLHSILGDLRIVSVIKVPELGPWPALRIVKGMITIGNAALITQINGLRKVDPTQVTRLEIYGNTLLSMCNNRFVCGYLALNKPYQLTNNAPGCNQASEIICTGGLVKGIAFYDRNENGLRDNGEPGILNMKVDVNTLDPQLISNEQGEMVFYCELTNTYTIKSEFNPKFRPTTDTMLVYQYDSVDENDTIFSFGFVHAKNAHEGKIRMTSDATRCNEKVNIYITATNEGSYDEKGRLILYYNDMNAMSDFMPQPNEINLNQGFAVWNFSNLIPPSSFKIKATLAVPSEDNVGDTLSFFTSYYIQNTDQSYQLLDSSIYNSLVRCAYDPNDISVSPIDTLYRYTSDTSFELTYTIRFQNLGNDTARQVRIYDLISTYLDRNSIQYISSSHSCNLRLYGDIFEIDFPVINLPAKVQNEEQSQGFISFTINTLPNLPNGTVIGNYGEIYFDQNAAIVTNTAINHIKDVLVNTEEASHFAFQWYPNPVHEWLCLRSNQDLSKSILQVYNSLGQIVYQGNGACHQFTFLTSGTYMAQLLSEKQTQSFVFVKQ